MPRVSDLQMHVNATLLLIPSSTQFASLQYAKLTDMICGQTLNLPETASTECT